MKFEDMFNDYFSNEAKEAMDTASMNKLAKMMKDLYDSFIKAGFDDKQALSITTTILSSAVNNIQGK